MEPAFEPGTTREAPRELRDDGFRALYQGARIIASRPEPDQEIAEQLDRFLSNLVGEDYPLQTTPRLHPHERELVLQRSIALAVEADAAGRQLGILPLEIRPSNPAPELTTQQIVHLVVRGKHHQHHLAASQDAYCIVSTPELLVAAGLDGVSSSKSSGWGAELLARRLSALVFDEMQRLNGADPSCAIVRGALHGKLLLACFDLADELQLNVEGYELPEDKYVESPFHATLRILIQTREWCAQLGIDDGYAVADGNFLAAATLHGESNAGRKISWLSTHPPLLIESAAKYLRLRNETWTPERAAYERLRMGESARALHLIPRLIGDAGPDSEDLLEFLKRFETTFPVLAGEIALGFGIEELEEELHSIHFAPTAQSTWVANRSIKAICGLLREMQSNVLTLDAVVPAPELTTGGSFHGIATDGARFLDVTTNDWAIRQHPKTASANFPLAPLLTLDREACVEVVEAYNHLVRRSAELRLEMQPENHDQNPGGDSLCPDLQLHPDLGRALPLAIEGYVREVAQTASQVAEEHIGAALARALARFGDDAPKLLRFVTSNSLYQSLLGNGAGGEFEESDTKLETGALSESLETDFLLSDFEYRAAASVALSDINARLSEIIRDGELQEYRAVLERHGISIEAPLHTLVPIYDDVSMVLLRYPA